MGTAAVQEFLTNYLRDPVFRSRYRGGDAAAIEVELGLDRTDISLVRELDLSDLDRTASGFRDDRFAKRETEFKPFLDHLAAWTSVDAFAEAFDAAYVTGTTAQPEELRRFLDFATRYVLEGGHPEYLLEMLRFCFHFCEVAIAPRIESKLPPADLGHGVLAHHWVRLLRPHRVLTFRFDVLAIARSTPSMELSALVPTPTRLLVIKDWAQARRAQVRYADEIPLLGPLLDGESRVLDLLARWSAWRYEELIGWIERLTADNVVEVTDMPLTSPDNTAFTKPGGNE